jgi:hypothetical protein
MGWGNEVGWEWGKNLERSYEDRLLFQCIDFLFDVLKSFKSQSRIVGLHGLGSHGKAIPSKDRIISEHSFLSVDHDADRGYVRQHWKQLVGVGEH